MTGNDGAFAASCDDGRLSAPRAIPAEPIDALPRLLADALPVCLSFVGADRCYRYVNRTYGDWFGHPRGDFAGHHVREVLGNAAYDVVRPYIDAALAGRAVSFRTIVPYHGAGVRDVEVQYVPMPASDGQMLGFWALVIDVDQRDGARVLRLDEERLQAALKASPTVLFTQDLDLRYTWVTNLPPGQTADRIIGRRDEDLVAPGAAAQLTTLKRAALDAGQPARGEVQIPAAPERTYDVNVEPLRDLRGNIIGVTGSAHDITGRKQAQPRPALPPQEIGHRITNMLETIEALVSLTASSAPTIEAFRPAVTDRIRALTGLQRLLLESGWDGTWLRNILDRELVPFDDGTGRRIELAGEPVRLPPTFVVPLGMALHELATNAAKHGALTRSSGSLSVRWELAGSGKARQLHLLWHERHGPPVVPPARQGLGSMLIDLLVADQLDGRATLTFAPAGLEAELGVPIPELA